MKKKLVYVLILTTLLLSGCQKVEDVEDYHKATQNNNTSMFVRVEQSGLWEVVYHKETKVMYVVSCGAYNAGSFTVLVDADGKPMLWED